MNRRAVSAALAAAIVVAGIAAWFGPDLFGAGSGVSVGGPFSLVDSAGHAVTDRDFRGRWMVLYFGYTHCPDACPTALGDIAEALSRLGDARRNIVAVFITIDPERDTQAVIGDYVRAFDPAMVGLTGTPAQIGAVTRAYRVYAEKHPTKDGGYDMDHSSLLYFVGPDGALAGLLGGESDAKAIVEKLHQLHA